MIVFYWLRTLAGASVPSGMNAPHSRSYGTQWFNPITQCSDHVFFLLAGKVLLPKPVFTYPLRTGLRKIHKVRESYGNIRAKRNPRLIPSGNHQCQQPT